MINEEEMERLKQDIMLQMQQKVKAQLRDNYEMGKTSQTKGSIRQIIEIKADLATEQIEGNYRKKVYEIGKELLGEI